MRKLVLMVVTMFGMSISHFNCAPMVGQRTLKDRSQPDNPRWLTNIPQSSRYRYFVGVSSENEQLDAAKREAIADALNDAISRQGVEVSIRYEQLNQNERRELKENLSVVGVGQIGLEQVSWYWELWEIYYRKEVTPKYRAYVLMRSKKLQPDSWTKVAFHNFTQRVETTWHSMLIPGWGQFRLKKYGKGRVFLLGELLAIGAYGYTAYKYEATKDEYEDLLFRISSGSANEATEEILLSRQHKERELGRFKDYRDRLLYISAGIYVLNLLDAFIFGTVSGDDFTVGNAGLGFRLARSPVKSSPVVKVEFHF